MFGFTVAILTDFAILSTDAHVHCSLEPDDRYKYRSGEKEKMRITIEMVLLVGSAAVALASPLASPEPPKPKDDNEDVGMNVAEVGRCPVHTTVDQYSTVFTDDLTD